MDKFHANMNFNMIPPPPPAVCVCVCCDCDELWKVHAKQKQKYIPPTHPGSIEIETTWFSFIHMSKGGIEEKISLTKVITIVAQNILKTQPQICPTCSLLQITKITASKLVWRLFVETTQPNSTRQYYWLSHTQQEEERQTIPKLASVLSACVWVEFHTVRKQ